MTNCDIRIWHTLAEVELFVFLFVIKLFLNCCCSIDVLYCFANFFLLRLLVSQVRLDLIVRVSPVEKKV